MTITAGVISLLSIAATTASLSATPATGGTAPYAYQWHRSLTSGFTPSGGTAIAGATGLTLNDTNLIPNTTYYWKLVATDAASGTVTYAQVSGTTTPMSFRQNTFGQQGMAGRVDLATAPNTTSALVDISQATPLLPGQAVKLIDTAGPGIPKVVACAANSDEVWGFINWDNVHQSFPAGSACEVSQNLNAISLYASTAIPRGSQVTLDLSSPCAVGVKVGSSGACIVGYAFDKADVPGKLIRVVLNTPSFQRA